jgi:hypothetical protein
MEEHVIQSVVDLEWKLLKADIYESGILAQAHTVTTLQLRLYTANFQIPFRTMPNGIEERLSFGSGARWHICPIVKIGPL